MTGVSAPALAGLLRDHWLWRLEQAPLFATRIGIHAFDE